MSSNRECESICFNLDCDVDQTGPRLPMLMPSAYCSCTCGLQLTKLWGPSWVSWVKALTVFSYFTAIFVPKNKINRKYVHLFRGKIKGRKIKKHIFREPKTKMKFGRPLHRGPLLVCYLHQRQLRCMPHHSTRGNGTLSLLRIRTHNNIYTVYKYCEVSYSMKWLNKQNKYKHSSGIVSMSLGWLGRPSPASFSAVTRNR